MRAIRLLSVTLISLMMSPMAHAAGTIRGEVRMAKSITTTIPESAALYVIARPEGQSAGMPLAVKRFSAPLKFPIQFELGASDQMMAGMPFEGKMSITARVAMQGSASPARAGDLETTKPVNAQTGASKPIVLEIDRVR